jgi:transcriptional regulator with XRE-family HTH domain
MKERMKAIRNSQNMTQQEFADVLKIKRNTIAKYETGRGEPIDAVIALICREFRVNEKWLRTGEGEMFVTQSRDEVIAEYLTKVAFGGETTAFQRSLISVMARMSVEEWELLEAKARELLEEVQKETAGDEADC